MTRVYESWYDKDRWWRAYRGRTKHYWLSHGETLCGVTHLHKYDQDAGWPRCGACVERLRRRMMREMKPVIRQEIDDLLEG